MTPESLLSEAITVPDPVPFVPLWHYGETINLLYTKKNMTYRAIAEWMRDRGMEYTTPHVRNALRKWRLNNGWKAEDA